jgi:uncharacterized glyoxalase superfamily protein PhnB
MPNRSAGRSSCRISLPADPTPRTARFTSRQLTAIIAAYSAAGAIPRGRQSFQHLILFAPTQSSRRGYCHDFAFPVFRAGCSRCPRHRRLLRQGVRLHLALHASDPGYAELQTGDTLLAFIGEEFVEQAALFGGLDYARSRKEAQAGAHLVAFVTDALEDDWRRALDAGATIVKAPEAKPWGQTAGYLRDLNGVIVELCTRSPRDG